VVLARGVGRHPLQPIVHQQLPNLIIDGHVEKAPMCDQTRWLLSQAQQ